MPNYSFIDQAELAKEIRKQKLRLEILKKDMASLRKLIKNLESFEDTKDAVSTLKT